MKIKNTTLDVIQGDIRSLKVDQTIEDIQHEDIDQHVVREHIANALAQAHSEKKKTLAIAPLGTSLGFPIVGSAKIMIQEVMKILRKDNVEFDQITFCIEDKNFFQVFDQSIRGYVQHIQDKLGLGPYVTVDIIIELKEGIILIERSNPPYGWALPGGFVDRGESLEQAAAREAKEETNMDLEEVRQFHTYSDPDRDPRFHTISTVFIAKGVGQPQFGDDAQDLQVIKYEDLLNLTYAFDHNAIIKDYLEHK